MPPSRTPGFEKYVQSEAARGAEFWMLEIMGTLEAQLGYVSQESFAQFHKLLEHARDEAAHAIAAAE